MCGKEDCGLGRPQAQGIAVCPQRTWRVKVRDFKAAMQENVKYAHHGLRVLRFEQLPALGAETNDPPGDIGSMRWGAFNTVRRTDNHVAIQPALILDEYRVTGKRGKKWLPSTEAVGPLVPVVFLTHTVLYIVPMLWNSTASHHPQSTCSKLYPRNPHRAYRLRTLLGPYEKRIVIIGSSAH